jgi:predicted nuclease of predicted toxin-antitoxin system
LIRLLLDQGLPRTTAVHLKVQGWDILHVGDIGLSKAKDLELIEYAKENGRVVVTLDSDFHAYLAVNNAEAPSVIRIRREGLKALEMAKLIISIWPKIDLAIQRGAMVTVTEESLRVRTLPIYRSDER